MLSISRNIDIHKDAVHVASWSWTREYQVNLSGQDSHVCSWKVIISGKLFRVSSSCKTRRRKEESALSSALSSPGTATPLQISPSLQVEDVREEDIEVTNEEMGGEGAGATPLAMNLMVDAEGVMEEEMEVTSGEMGGDGAEGGGEIPPRMTQPPTTKPKPKTAVFILWDCSEAMKTMSICLDNSGNRVVTRVDKGTKLSSCSRDPCQQ